MFSSLSLSLCVGFLLFLLFKIPSEVKAVPGTLNINTTTPGTTNFPGNGVWTSAGNVGIGTTGPSTKLDVSGYLRAGNRGTNINSVIIDAATGLFPVSTTAEWATPFMYRSMRNPDNGTGSFPWNNYGELILQGTSYGDSYNRGISFVTTPNDLTTPAIRMRVDPSGNVGIGTTGPSYKLHIVGTDAFAGIGIDDVSANRGILQWHSADGLRLVTTTAKPIVFFTNNAGPRMTIASDGNVGIGTTGPPRKLSVYASSGSAAPFILATNDYNNVNIGSMFAVEFGAASGNTFSSLVALSAGGTAWNNLILQYGGGNVGIGTTGPGERLDLGGGNIKMGYTQISATQPVGGGYLTCPAGTYVIGGGHWPADNWTTMIASAPASSTQWQCGGGQRIYCYAICANIR